MDIHQTVVIRPVEIRIVEEKEDFEREQNNPFESFVRRRKREEASGGPSKLPPWYFFYKIPRSLIKFLRCH